MREPSFDYRTAATPQPVVCELRVASAGETALYILAGVLGVGFGLVFTILPSVLLAVATLIPASIAAFARYGRTSARIEYLPRSGEIEIVTGGFLAPTTRRRFRAGDIHCVSVERIDDRGLAIPPMYMLVLELENRRIEHVFGRPLGLPPAEAEALRAKLTRAIDDARTERPRVRVELDEEAEDEGALDDADDAEEAEPLRKRRPL